MFCHIIQDASIDAIVESFHAKIPIQLVWSSSYQIFIKGYGVPSFGSRWYLTNTNLASEWWMGLAKGGELGIFTPMYLMVGKVPLDKE